jgi:hypothetical protein
MVRVSFGALLSSTEVGSACTNQLLSIPVAGASAFECTLVRRCAP